MKLDFDQIKVGDRLEKVTYHIPFYRVDHIFPPSTKFGWTKGRRSILATNETYPWVKAVIWEREPTLFRRIEE